MRKIRKYDEDFKRETVEHIFESKKTVSQVARELDISVHTLHGWVKQYKQMTGQDSTKSLDVSNLLLMKGILGIYKNEFAI
ncbi:transposase [Ammoniphilus sp. 3BR4]|uniref:transposase n=1 Tax=Ammoniphilus sp. 3BR4 TaxID=3158265 RepID=UPI0034667F3D